MVKKESLQLKSGKVIGYHRIEFLRYDLRHSYVAMLISQGENIKFIQHQLGHSSIKTTLDRYGHLIPEVHTEAAKRLDETLFSQNHISKTLAEKRKSQSYFIWLRR